MTGRVSQPACFAPATIVADKGVVCPTARSGRGTAAFRLHRIAMVAGAGRTGSEGSKGLQRRDGQGDIVQAGGNDSGP